MFNNGNNYKIGVGDFDPLLQAFGKTTLEVGNYVTVRYKEITKGGKVYYNIEAVEVIEKPREPVQKTLNEPTTPELNSQEIGMCFKLAWKTALSKCSSNWTQSQFDDEVEEWFKTAKRLLILVKSG